MVIVRLSGGLGNQFYQYACARCLAYKLNTQLKIDLSTIKSSNSDKPRFYNYYKLNAFNILENFATPQEIKIVKENGIITPPAPNIENIQGDIYIKGYWMQSENFFIDIIDIIRKEFTLKKPFNLNSEAWREKILSAENSVAMHFRHGDYAYNPLLKSKAKCLITPFDFYYTCVNILKQRYSNLTIFVFSDNLPGVKENLHLDVPTEFVEGCETTEEEFILMSLCKHDIIPTSTFSQCAASLNANPDKKIFWAVARPTEEYKKIISSLTSEKKQSILNAHTWIRIPFDSNYQQEITIRPFFSLLLVVNNDAATLSETLDSILAQDYKYYELIIIDNASTDGSDKICQKVIVSKKNVTYKRLESKVKNATAWNIAFQEAQGYYISFLKSNDRFLANSLTLIYSVNYPKNVDIIQSCIVLKEDEKGTITFGDKKYSEQLDPFFQKQTKPVIVGANGPSVAKLLLDQQINRFLGTKFFYKEFLKDNQIKFDERLFNEEAEISFQINCFSNSKFFMHVANSFYIAPRK